MFVVVFGNNLFINMLMEMEMLSKYFDWLKKKMDIVIDKQKFVNHYIYFI